MKKNKLKTIEDFYVDVFTEIITDKETNERYTFSGAIKIFDISRNDLLKFFEPVEWECITL